MTTQVDLDELGRLYNEAAVGALSAGVEPWFMFNVHVRNSFPALLELARRGAVLHEAQRGLDCALSIIGEKSIGPRVTFVRTIFRRVTEALGRNPDTGNPLGTDTVKAAAEDWQALAIDRASQLSASQARVRELKDALRPFADLLKGHYSQQPDSAKLEAGLNANDLRFAIPLGDFRRARASLTKGGEAT